MTSVVANEQSIAGKYRSILELGRGGMAVVYLAVVRGPAGFNKLQVIKQLRPELAREPDQIAMFLNEARVSARINHPNVVQINEIGRDNDAYFMAMEYVDGQTLERVFRTTRGDIPVALHLKVLAEALAGLHAAHELKDFDGSALEIVHRDVSPHNILVGYEGEVKVLDFGIAKVAGSRSETRTGVLKGKFTYMAPEQFLGQRIDRRTDVFAAGVMLWQAVVKRRLWGREINEIEVYRRVCESRIPRPRDIDPSVPLALDEMAMKALATDPANRYQSADEFRAAIEEYLATEKAHPTSRDLGALVNKHFAQERQAIRTAIEERLRRTTTEAIPEVPMLRSLLPSTMRDASADRLSASSVTETAGASSSSLSLSDAPFLDTHLRSTRPWYRSLRAIAAALVVAAAATVLVTWRPWNRPASTKAAVGEGPQAVASPSAVAVPQPPGGAAPAATLTELTVHAVPVGAKISIDGIEVEENPFVGRFVRDGASHRVRADAPGFASKSVRVDFTSPTASADISLEHQTVWSAPPRKDKGGASAQAPAAAAPPAASSTSGVPPSASAAPAPGPGLDAKPSRAPDDPWAKRKKPSFDSSDPWK